MADIKLIVKIDANVYKRLFNNAINGIQDNEIAADDICEMARALSCGKPLPEGQCINIPEGFTNGEALLMLFPNMHYTLSDISPRVVTTIGVASSFDIDWWKAPYKKVGVMDELNAGPEEKN